MPVTINAKGLPCPHPVMLAKKGLESDSELIILVDNRAACDNIRRLATNLSCSAEIAEEADATFRIHIRKTAEACEVISEGSSIAGPTIFVIASDVMGSGDDGLGAILMKAFIHTATELEHRPDLLILYNSGVRLAAADSGAVDDLKVLEAKGCRIIICGTCADFFKLTGKIGAGSISNMYEIADKLSKAGRIVRP